MKAEIRKLAETLAEEWRRELVSLQSDPEAQALLLAEINQTLEPGIPIQPLTREELLGDPEAAIVKLEINPRLSQVAKEHGEELRKWASPAVRSPSKALQLFALPGSQ